MHKFQIISNRSQIPSSSEWIDISSSKPFSFFDHRGQVVHHKSYQGDQYQVVAVKERQFGIFERIGRAAFAAFLVLASGFILLAFQSGRDLVKSLLSAKERVWFAELFKKGVQSSAQVKDQAPRVAGSAYKRLLDFYLRGEALAGGLTLQQVWDLPLAQKESRHNFIGWLFPTRSRGGDPTAPCLKDMSPEEIASLQNNQEFKQNLLISLRSMLTFFGGKEAVVRGFTRYVVNNRRAFDSVMRHPHNFKRVTRIITCLRFFGYQRQAIALLNFFGDGAAENPGYRRILCEGSNPPMGYWRRAVA